MAMRFPKNVAVAYRYEATEIRDVRLTGRIRYEYDGDNEGWTIGDDDDKASIEEWIDAFDGKDVEITIKMRNYSEQGAKMEMREVVNAN